MTTHSLVCLRYEIESPHVGEKSLRAIMLSDFHLNEATDPRLYDEAIALAQEYAPDILIFGGD